MEKFAVEETAARKEKRLVGSFFNKQKYIIISVLIFVCTMAVRIFVIDFNTEVGIRQLTVQIIALAMLTYSAYWVMTDFGKEKGVLSDNYVGAKKFYYDIRKRVADKKYNIRLNEFCKAKKKDITEERRREYIMDTTVSYNKYVTSLRNKDKKTLQDEGLSRQEIRLVRKADRYKAPNLQASMLWVSKSFEEQFALISRSGAKSMAFHRIKKAITTAVIVIISGSLYASAVAQFDWTIIFQVLCLALNMFLGYRDGFDSFAVIEAERYSCKGELLEEAYVFCESTPPEIEPKLEQNVTKMLPNMAKPQDIV